MSTNERTCNSNTSIFAKGYNFYKVFWVFLLGGTIGAFVEIIFCRFSMGRWMSRSSLLYGQFSIVWGLGVAAFTIVFHKYLHAKNLTLFIMGTLLGGAYEYICSFVIEKAFHLKFWDYSKIPFNINGRINLLFCFFWGLVAILWVRIVYPNLSSFIEKIPPKTGHIATWILILSLATDTFLSAGALARISQRESGHYDRGKIETFIDQNYPTDYLIKRYQNILPSNLHKKQ